MARALVCNKWTLDIDDKYLAHVNGFGVKEAPFFVQLVKRIGDVSRGAIAAEWLLSELPVGKRVTEFFGGAGRNSLIVERILQPSQHNIYDMNTDCIEHLQTVFGGVPHISVIHGDSAIAMMEADADIFLLDFNRWTLLQHLQEKLWYEQWRVLLSKTPLAFVWTDTSSGHFHLNKAHYSKHFGVSIDSKENYTRFISHWMEREFGYQITKAAYHCGEFDYLAEPMNGKELVERHISNDEHGFFWVNQK